MSDAWVFPRLRPSLRKSNTARSSSWRRWIRRWFVGLLFLLFVFVRRSFVGVEDGQDVQQAGDHRIDDPQLETAAKLFVGAVEAAPFAGQIDGPRVLERRLERIPEAPRDGTLEVEGLIGLLIEMSDELTGD